MKRYLVKFHGDNEEGLPAQWPSEKNVCDDFDNVPDDCVLMNDEQYEAHISKYQHLYDEWKQKKNYKANYKNKRKNEYPSSEEMFEALYEVVVDRLVDKRNIPVKLKAVMDKRAEIDKKYPDPND